MAPSRHDLKNVYWDAKVKKTKQNESHLGQIWQEHPGLAKSFWVFFIFSENRENILNQNLFWIARHK